MPKLNRYQANCLIMVKLQQLIDRYPDQRFHQILQNIGVENPGNDQFYEESVDTLVAISRYEAALKQIAKGVSNETLADIRSVWSMGC